MHASQLFEHVAAEDRGEAQRLYEAYLRMSGGTAEENIDSFANALHQRGLLSAEGLKDFLTYHGLTIGALGTSDEQSSRYQLLTLLAHGAMGEVYLGRDPSLHRTVAVKRVHADLAGDPLLLQRFFNEAQVTAQLDHPAIVPVYGLERDTQGALSYAMKLVRGVTLSQFLEDARAQLEIGGKADAAHSLKARIESFIPVLNALAYAHRRGVVHRDLKPDNIMVGGFGEVLVMDWGIARVLGHDALDAATSAAAASGPAPSTMTGTGTFGTHPKLTLAGTVLGTPAYMSPEQAAGLELDASSDQYSLGLILQEIVTLEPAMRGDELAQMLARAVRGAREPMVAGPEPIARELRAIIDKATAPKRGERYPSVAALAEDLRRFLRDESVEADPDRGLQKLTRWIGAHRGLAMTIGAIFAIVSFAAVVLFIWRGQVALAEEREATRRREAALAGIEALVEARANQIGVQLHHYEALLEGIASSATLMLREPAQASDAVVYAYHGDKSDPAEPPSYAHMAPAYGQLASLRADFSASWGVDRDKLRWRTDQLARMEPILRNAVVRSISEDAVSRPFAELEELILQRGAPVMWTYLSLEDGVAIGVPGTWLYEDSPGAPGYDHRREDWYRVAVDSRGPLWTITADESGIGLTVNCVQTVRDDSGKLIAIAGLDIWLDRFVDELLEISDLAKAGGEALMLDAQGRVLIRTSERNKARTLTDYQPLPFESATVLAAIRTRPSGHLVTDDARLAVWSTLGSAGLTYVVLGAEAPLLSVVAAE